MNPSQGHDPTKAPLPLAGVRILLTRPRDQAEPLRQRLVGLGAETLIQPAIHIGDPPDRAPVDAALDRLDAYDWLVFSSANGVGYLLGRILARDGHLGRLGRVKLAAIGPATADALRRHGHYADLVPGEYRAEALARELIDRCCMGRPATAEEESVEDESVDGHVAEGRSAEGQPAQGESVPPPRLLLVRASRGREVLAEQLSAAGAAVDQVVVYSSTDVTQPDAEVAAAMATGRIDWVTVTSSAIARSLDALFGENLRRTRLASISPITSETLRRLGHEPAAEAAEYTTDGLVAAILAGEER